MHVSPVVREGKIGGYGNKPAGVGKQDLGSVASSSLEKCKMAVRLEDQDKKAGGLTSLA